jgi:F-type H+-transporting ATPase subunit b
MQVSALTLIAEESAAENFYPNSSELIVGLLSFVVIFFFFWKYALPKLNVILDERRDKIVGEMERAEQERKDADKLLEDYRKQLAGARDDANKIIEEARKTADQLRLDLTARAQHDADALVVRAQEEIRAERDRVFQELKASVGQMSVELAGRVVGESLDAKRHEKLVDQYIDQVAGLGNGDGS